MSTSKDGGPEHIASYRSHQRGCSPIGGRPLYGWNARCDCGWELKSNEKKAYAVKRFREHLLAARSATQTKENNP